MNQSCTNNGIPHGIACHSVHPAGKRGLFPGQFQTPGNRLRPLRKRFGLSVFPVHISHPHQPVSLFNSIPDIFLHIQCTVPGSHVPDTVQKRIAAGKTAQNGEHPLYTVTPPAFCDFRKGWRSLLKSIRTERKPRFPNPVHAHHPVPYGVPSRTDRWWHCAFPSGSLLASHYSSPDGSDLAPCPYCPSRQNADTAVDLASRKSQQKACRPRCPLHSRPIPARDIWDSLSFRSTSSLLIFPASLRGSSTALLSWMNRTRCFISITLKMVLSFMQLPAFLSDMAPSEVPALSAHRNP